MVFRGTEMNIGFYVHNTSQSDLNSQIFSLLNDSVQDGEVDDATLFYNEVDHNPSLDTKKFGLFNSTDMWSFQGTLVVTSLSLLGLATKVVNKINLIYMYTKDNFEYGNTGAVLSLIHSSVGDVKTVAKTEEDAREYKRMTGKEIVVLKGFNAKGFLEV